LSPSSEVTVSTVVMKPVPLSSVATTIAIMKGKGSAPGVGKVGRPRALDKVAEITPESGGVTVQI
jgi:hypothetical protein